MDIIYAFCCLGITAVNDFIFKLFANHAGTGNRQRSCGLFVTFVGCVDFLFMVCLERHVSDPSFTILWGCISGFFSVSSNILLIESMRFLSAGICSTIFRLNMVLVVIGSHLLFREPLTASLVTGIVCAFIAILAFIPRGNSTAATNTDAATATTLARTGFALAVLASVLRACMSLSYKYAFDHGADVNAVATINGLWWIFGGILYALLREHRIPRPTRHDLIIGLTSGAFVCGIIFFMARMNACGNASVVNPIAQMSFLGTFLLSAVFLRKQEPVTVAKVVALLLGCAAIVCLTLK